MRTIAEPLKGSRTESTIQSMNTNHTIGQTVEPETDAGETEQRPASYAADKAKILARLRRIEGQVRGVQRMIEEDKYCVDVLTQLSAIIASARAAGLLILEDHIRGCVVTAPPEDREIVLEELTEAIERFARTVG
jgi:CsoR family transcriptional regulator, copper-sensing transcriptional repressor